MKSKHKFKKIICTLFLALTIGFCSLNLTALAAENTENSFNEKFEIHDKTAEEKYLNLISQNKSPKLYSSQDPSQFGDYNYEALQSGDFNTLLNISSDKNPNFKIVYSNDTENAGTSIIQDINNNNYILYEGNIRNNSFLFIVNGERYVIEGNLDNLTATSEFGNKFYISKSEEVENPNGDYNISTYGSWGKNYGPYYKTNKVVVEVLGYISGATAMVSFIHPILGTISTITGVISFVGSVAYATLYIEYWQAYMDDCPSYVLETQWYYAKPNYTDLVKTYQYKFHSIRPDEAGGACMNY